MIKSIFFSRFDTDKGPVVLHQVPDGSVTPRKDNEPARLSLGAGTPPRGLAASPVPMPTSPSAKAAHGASTPLSASGRLKALAPASPKRQPLFDFAAVSDFIIPRQEFCNQLLTVCSNHYRIIGFPVCISDVKRYSWNRNEYIFNFCLVLDEYADATAHIKVVKSVARMLRALEEESGFLSKDEQAEYSLSTIAKRSSGASWKDEVEVGPLESGRGDDRDEQRREDNQEDCKGGRPTGEGKVYALCEMLLEDLNNYCECMIPVDGITTLSVRLAPTLPPPPPVHAWHVPVPTVRLSSLTDSNWDLTMLALIPFLDGTHTVAAAARKARTRVELARKAVQDLLFYGCVLLLDAFTFGAVYAPTPLMGAFVADRTAPSGVEYPPEEQQEVAEASTEADLQAQDSDTSNYQAECAAFVSHPGCTVTHDELITLFCSLRPGLTLRQWCMDPAHSDILTRVDVRRLISYGVINGFLYRIHRYVATPLRPGTATPNATAKGSMTVTPGGGSGAGSAGKRNKDGILPLARYLDGLHCLDEMCTELEMSDRNVLSKVRGHGDVYLISR